MARHRHNAINLDARARMRRIRIVHVAMACNAIKKEPHVHDAATRNAIVVLIGQLAVGTFGSDRFRRPVDRVKHAIVKIWINHGSPPLYRNL